jgi:uncharacterized protein (DUF2384 family)
MTKFGKFLVFANLFAGVGLFAWAMSLYANSLAYFDTADADPKVEGLFTTLKKEVDDLNNVVTTGQREYARRSEITRQLENERYRRLARLTDRLVQIRKGDDQNILFRAPAPLTGPLLPNFPDLGTAAALIDVQDPGKVVRSTRDTDLNGLGFLRSEMAKAVKDEQSLAATIRDKRREMDRLNTEIEAGQNELFAQKLIRTNLDEQKQFLGDSGVNWDEQLRTLQRRKGQLEGRLSGLAGGTGSTMTSR